MSNEGKLLPPYRVDLNFANISPEEFERVYLRLLSGLSRRVVARMQSSYPGIRFEFSNTPALASKANEWYFLDLKLRGATPEQCARIFSELEAEIASFMQLLRQELQGKGK